MIKKSIFIFLILIINGITNTTEANIFLSIPQFGIVLFYVITGKIDKAVFLHILFFITSYTYFGDFQGYVDEVQLNSFNYAKLKFIGPVSYSYIISLLLLLIVNFKYNLKLNKNEIFYNFYKLLIYFMVTGFGIGLMGMAFGNYYIEGFANYGSYVLIAFIHANILMKMSDTTLRKDLVDIIIPLLAITPIVNFIIRQIHPEMIDSSVISLFSVLLLPALLFQKKGLWLNLIGLFFHIYNIIVFKSSGKELIFLVIIAFITLFLTFSKNIKKEYPFRARLIRNMMLTFIIALPTIVIIIFNTYDSSTLIVSKIHQVKSLANFIFLKGEIDTIAPSPYVRVTSLINILYEGLHNPFSLLFGKGYGGYFQDHFHFFSHLDLSKSAFPDKAILTGHFFTGHDTMVTVPMFNGLIGLFLILRLVWRCIQYSKNNFIMLSAIPFLLLVFYFDTLIGVTGVLFFYLGSVNLKNLKE